MATSYRGFLIELYEEYLEEASFLYEQRLGLFDDPEITWLDIDDWEQRIEAHIDGLVVGDALALEICQRQAEAGDFGELYAALCVFCRQNRVDRVFGVLDNLDFEDAERVRAVTDALKYELPAAWQDDFCRRLSTAYPELAAVLAEIIGYRRIPATAELLRIMARTPGRFLPPVIRALGRSNDPSVQEPLCHYLQHDDPSVRTAAVEALLRLGERQALERCMQDCRPESELLIPLGLSGSQAHSRTLADFVSSGSATDDCLIALGLLGDPQSLDLLVAQLESEHAEAVALALHLLTGAAPLEEVYIPEDIDEDELFEEELKQYRAEGKVPTRLDGQPFGENVTRLSRNPEHWHQWLKDNGSRFLPGVRYRAGHPCTPQIMLQALRDERTVHRARRLTADELVIRYRLDWPFETDLPVARQRQLLSETGPKQGTYQRGVWYFGSRIIATSGVVSAGVGTGWSPAIGTAERKPSASNYPVDTAALWTLRDKVVHHASGTLAQLMRLDQMLTARLEELYAAGAASWTHAETALEQRAEGAVFVAILLALKSGRQEQLQTAVRAGCATPAAFRELISALGWLPYERIAAWIDQLLASRFAINRRIGLSVCSVHRRDPGKLLIAASDDPDPQVQARALRLVGELKRRDLADAIESRLNSPEPASRFWAAWSCALLRRRPGIDVLQQVAESDSPLRDKALQLLLRSLSPPEAVDWLRKLTTNLGQTIVVAKGIGIIGLANGIPWLLARMRSAELTEPAGSAFLAITGAQLAGSAGESTLSGYLTPSIDSDEAEQWWALHKDAFEPGIRYLEGQPIAAGRCRALLRNGRQRQAAALELAFLQAEEPLFEVRAPGPRQQHLLS